MSTKKILIGLGAAAAAIASIALFAAYEAHVINVTAHIENALELDTYDIDFGTVFPQEYVEERFTVRLSESFMGEDNADDVNYVIRQKPKPTPELEELLGVDEARRWCHKHGAGAMYPEDKGVAVPILGCYLSLCDFLSKNDGDLDDQYDTSHPSYYHDPDGVMGNEDDYCEMVVGEARGRLAKSQNDNVDPWIVDLKVPPVEGFVGQDWPLSCLEWVVPEDSEDYGCDLWIEVTGISRVPTLGEQEQTSMSLENKNADGWFVLKDGTFGVLTYVTAGPTFDYHMTAQGLRPDTEYSLIYYADPWAGNHPGALIESGKTNAAGEMTLSGSPDLGMDLPHPDDANYMAGAKVWLVLSADYDEASHSMTAWHQTEYLYEYNLIHYDDTDIP